MKRWERWLRWTLISLLLLLGIVYASDWLVLKRRVAQGSGYGTVEVNQFLATSLKGDKTEYDLTGTMEVKCVHSLFPHQGFPACWRVERNKAQWQQ